MVWDGMRGASGSSSLLRGKKGRGNVAMSGNKDDNDDDIHAGGTLWLMCIEINR